MKRALAAFFTVFAALAQCEDIVKFSRVEEMRVEDADNLGRKCCVRGVVSLASGIEPGFLVLASTVKPYRAGIPVLVADGVSMPGVGDEVWVKGKTSAIKGRVGIAADGVAAISSVGSDFSRTLKYTDFREGRLDWRRVNTGGTVRNVSERDGVSVITMRNESGFIDVRIPGEADKDGLLGREVRATGVVIPMTDEGGVVIGRCIEAGGERDVALLVHDWTPTVLAASSVALAAAFLAALVAWIRSRRERIRIAAVMEERKRMAKDLHDTIEQHLATVQLLISGAVNRQNIDMKAHETLLKASEVLANAKTEVRDAVLNLRNDEALNKTPADAMKELAASVTASGAARVRTALRGLPDSMPQDRYQDLLLIVREAVTNAIKHGKAVNIVIAADPGWKLRVLNDGEPFDAATALGPETGHFGLSGMRERAARSGFGISFSSQGRWTAVTIQAKQR